MSLLSFSRPASLPSTHPPCELPRAACELPRPILVPRIFASADSNFAGNHNKKRRGEIAELRFALACMERGLAVAKPYGDSERYDCVVIAGAPAAVGRPFHKQSSAVGSWPSGATRAGGGDGLHAEPKRGNGGGLHAERKRAGGGDGLHAELKRGNGGGLQDERTRAGGSDGLHAERTRAGGSDGLQDERKRGNGGGGLHAEPKRGNGDGLHAELKRAGGSDGLQSVEKQRKKSRASAPARGLSNSALPQFRTSAILTRVQVRSAHTLHHAGYDIALFHGAAARPYAPGDFDLLAAYVAPHRAWYLIPFSELGRHGVIRTSLSLYPHTPASRGRFERFRNRWDLLF